MTLRTLVDRSGSHSRVTRCSNLGPMLYPAEIGRPLGSQGHGVEPDHFDRTLTSLCRQHPQRASSGCDGAHELANPYGALHPVPVFNRHRLQFPALAGYPKDPPGIFEVDNGADLGAGDNRRRHGVGVNTPDTAP